MQEEEFNDKEDVEEPDDAFDGKADPLPEPWPEEKFH
jgi:hypothetical protein